MDYRSKKSLHERKIASQKLLSKYPDKVPIIVSKLSKLNPWNDLTKRKFLCPKELTIAQFIHILRKFLEDINMNKAIFLTLEQDKLVLPESGAKLSELYEKYKNEDGFLYAIVYTENVFG